MEAQSVENKLPLPLRTVTAVALRRSLNQGAQAVQAAASPGYCKIVADPGLYLKITWARVKNELTTQLKHPEKLRDDDVIECYAQIYEAQRTLLASELAALELGDVTLASQFHPQYLNPLQFPVSNCDEL